MCIGIYIHRFKNWRLFLLLILVSFISIVSICHAEQEEKNFTPKNNTSSLNPAALHREIIIRFNKNISEKEIQAMALDKGVIIKKYIKQLNYYVVTFPSCFLVKEMPKTELYETLNEVWPQVVVDRAEPNYSIPLETIPDDPYFPEQWSLQNLYRLEGWDSSDQNNPKVAIAIIDTGVDYTHKDLAANIWHNTDEIPDNGLDDDGNGYIDDLVGWDFVDALDGGQGEDSMIPDNDPMDKHGHGTHVAGIAGAVTHNGVGIAGVSWNCQIMPVRAGYKNSSGMGVLKCDDAAQAIIYAAENGAKVINLSWGDSWKSTLIEEAITFAASKGVFICAAAGNSRSDKLVYPAASANEMVLAVGATDSYDQIASFSNYGDWVDVSAPGVDIYGTYLNNSYRKMSGTSMSTPHVAGEAALLFYYFPDLLALEVKARIMRSVDVFPHLNGKNSASGIINIFSTLTAHYHTPYIFSISPNIAREGDVITIFGDSFGTDQGTGAVNFCPDKKAEIISWSRSLIVCKAPHGAQTGELTMATLDGTSNGIEVTVLKRFYDETLIKNEFLGAGQAQGWNDNDQSWLYQLPFSFPFFDQHYDKVSVCSNGYLDFTDNAPSLQNSTEVFKTKVMIAPLWDDLITNGQFQQGEDIFIHSPSPDSVCIRWAGELYGTGTPINVEVILFKDGRIKFNYGQGNVNIHPIIGLCGGNNEKCHLCSYTENDHLTEVQTVLFMPRDRSFTIPLDLGWNLISLPLRPDDNQVSSIISPISSGIESIWGYINKTWQPYIPPFPQMSELDTLIPGYGYWMKTNQTGISIQIDGQVETTPILLSTGWNLIGFNSLESKSVNLALASIEGNYEVIWGFKNGLWQIYDPHNPGLSDLNQMEPGRGYWIKYK